MFSKGDNIHLIGIKGVGMTALAQILVSRGCVVTGSDGPDTFFTDAVLKRLKIPFVEKFSPENISVAIDLVISSVAYYFNGKSLNNVEVQTAIDKKLKILTYPQALGELSKNYKVIAVAGSHGKSTTTALLGWLLEKAKIDPTVIVGTKVNTWESNARAGKSEELVIEADEYREAFLSYKPFGAIITSIDWDHPDYFPTPEKYYQAFKKLVDSIDSNGWLVGYGDDVGVRALLTYAKAKKLKTISYGFQKDNDFVLTDDGIVKQQQMFHIQLPNKETKSASIMFAGKQYILNAGAAVIAAHVSGGSLDKVISAVASFPGTARRLEVIKKPTKAEPAIIIDDYAHHPTAISVTLAGVKKLYPDKKLIVIFQPHMFSRTEALLESFSKCFTLADRVGIMEIFSSARETSGPVSGKDLAAATKEHHRYVTYLPDMAAGKQFVKQFLADDCVIMLMGAGDVYKLAS